MYNVLPTWASSGTKWAKCCTLKNFDAKGLTRALSVQIEKNFYNRSACWIFLQNCYSSFNLCKHCILLVCDFAVEMGSCHLLVQSLVLL